MKIPLKMSTTFLVLIIFNISGTISMLTEEHTCDGADTADMVQWYTQVYQFAKRNQNVTQHIFDLQAKLHQMERSVEENHKTVAETSKTLAETLKTLAETHKTLAETHKTLQETHNKLEQCLKDQPQTTNGDIVIQRRQDGSVDFYRNWAEYKAGFGNSSGEFFIGLDKLHKLTNSRPYELLIVLEDWENDRRYAKYEQFIVGSEAEKYALKQLGNYSGSAGDALTVHVGQKFTTKDQDNDPYAGNCAVEYTGAWWYKQCHHSNLNGRYLKGKHTEYAQGVNWFPFQGHHYSLKFAEMTIRPC